MNEPARILLSAIVVKNLMKALIAANRRIKALENELQKVKEIQHASI